MDLFALPAPRVLTIPPTAPFLKVLANALWHSQADADFALADTIVLLPTRRAARVLGQELLTISGKSALLLPAIRTLGDLDPDEAALADLSDTLALPPAINPMQRRLELASLVRARGKASGEWSDDPVAALNAADALCELLDSAALAGDTVDWSRLPDLVAETDLAQHWQQSVAFLSIITENWPARLAELGQTDPGTRQRAALVGIADRWAEKPPQAPVFIAGSTGTVPATRALMAVVAHLERGSVILPGLDKKLPDSAWAQAAKDDQHPQRSMALVLKACGITDRGAVEVMPGIKETSQGRLRLGLLNDALTPAEATGDWHQRIQELRGRHHAPGDAVEISLAGLSLAEAATEEEEASAIALKLRHTLEIPHATAALVTPDSDLAARVAAKLHRWGIVVDASAGRPLSASQPGSFFSLVLAWALDPVEPVALCAMLKHPLCALRLPASTKRELAALLETKVLRTSRAYRSLDDVVAITLLEKRERISWPSVDKQHATSDLMRRIEAASVDLFAAFAQPLTLGELARSLTCAAESLATEASGTSALWAGEAGNSAAVFLDEVVTHGDVFGLQTPSNAVRLFKALMEGRVVRPRGSHPRLAILGPLEARLLSFDHTIVGGLDEGVWPALPKADPFLSRPMREALGLPSAEQRIGLQAHDFIQLAAAPSVMLTRAARRGDAPTVPSRWLWRLNTLAEGALGEEAAKKALAAEPLAWARDLLPRTRTYDNKAARPQPKPPVSLRPTKFSATEIEKWVRDPYSIYAAKVLGLSALSELGTPIGARDRGTAIHAALENLTKGPSLHPSAIEGRLTILLQEALQEAGYSGVTLAGDMVRLKPAIAAFAAWERERSPLIAKTYIENRGEVTLDTPHGKLTLSARADRIDQTKAGAVDIIDYKTGGPPSGKQVQTFLASQLPVTGLIVANGGFDDIGKRNTNALIYFRFGSQKPGASQAGWIGRSPDGLENEPSPASLIQKAQEGLSQLMVQYSRPEQVYLSKPRPQFANEYGDFDHLARRAEWAAIADGNDGESEFGE